MTPEAWRFHRLVSKPYQTAQAVFLWLVHTANMDKTRLSCLVVLSCRQCELSSRQSQTAFNMLETEQFCLVCGVNAFENKTRLSSHRISRLDKTVSKFSVAHSLQFSSHREHWQDKTRQDSLLSMFMVWTSHQSPCTRYDSKPTVLNHQYFVQCKYVVQLHFVNIVKKYKRQTLCRISLFRNMMSRSRSNLSVHC